MERTTNFYGVTKVTILELFDNSIVHPKTQNTSEVIEKLIDFMSKSHQTYFNIKSALGLEAA